MTVHTFMKPATDLPNVAKMGTRKTKYVCRDVAVVVKRLESFPNAESASTSVKFRERDTVGVQEMTHIVTESMNHHTMLDHHHVLNSNSCDLILPVRPDIRRPSTSLHSLYTSPF